MIIKTIVSYLTGNSNYSSLALILDIILLIFIVKTREIKLILLFFVISILNIILELFFQQMKILSDLNLTANNLAKQANCRFILRPDIRLAI